MISVHSGLREALGTAAPMIGSVPAGDLDRAETVGSFYANVLAFLHAHHEGEDELVWPRLVERVPDQAAEVLRAAAHHENLFGALESAEARLTDWRETPDIDSGAVLAG